jgi:hypothetical protein
VVLPDSFAVLSFPLINTSYEVVCILVMLVGVIASACARVFGEGSGLLGGRRLGVGISGMGIRIEAATTNTCQLTIY